MISKDPVILNGPSGQIIGIVPPATRPGIAVPFSEQELQWAEAETEEYTLAEILADLEKQ